MLLRRLADMRNVFSLFLSTILVVACRTGAERCAIPDMRVPAGLYHFSIQYNEPLGSEQQIPNAMAVRGNKYKMIGTKHGAIIYMVVNVQDCGNYLPGYHRQGNTLFFEYRKYGCNECSYLSNMTLSYEVNDPALAEPIVYFNDSLLTLKSN